MVRKRLIERLVPDLAVSLQAGGVGLVAGWLGGWLAGVAHRRVMRVAYTRKLFHFSIFTVAAATYALWGLPGTNVFGAIVALRVVIAVVREAS